MPGGVAAMPPGVVMAQGVALPPSHHLARHHRHPHPHPHPPPPAAHHYQAGAAPTTVAAGAVAPNVHMQQLMEQQVAEELRKSAKRAANRRSASTCRARKKFLVENMAEANNMMRKRSKVLSLLPDMILAMRRDGVVTYASENCRQFLKFAREEVQGANIFDLVDAGSHERLRRLLEENLGSVSKEAIASALRHQGTTFEDLLARSEKAKQEGDSSFFSASGEAPRLPGPVSPTDPSRKTAQALGVGARRRPFSWAVGPDVDASTDDWESEVTSSACEGFGRTSTSGGGSGTGSGSGGGSGGGDSSGTSEKPPRARTRPLPPLGPAVFSATAIMKAEGGGTASGGARQGGAGGGRALVSSAVAVPSDAKGMKEGEGSTRAFGVGSDTSSTVGTSEGGASMMNVDRDLQSKINAFTNNQKDLCKLEIIRQDKKSDWYEVRSSMRLVWLKTKQEIVPVEVICSFQQMHSDGPAGSANSIVARLQRAAAMVRALPADSNGNSDYFSGLGNSSGFSASGESNGAGCSGSGSGSLSGSLNGSLSGSLSGGATSGVEAVSSSDYGGGTSSGSISGEGCNVQNSDDERNSKASTTTSSNSSSKQQERQHQHQQRRQRPQRKEKGIGGGPARKRARGRSPEVVSVPIPCGGAGRLPPTVVTRKTSPGRARAPVANGGREASSGGGEGGSSGGGAGAKARAQIGEAGGGGNDVSSTATSSRILPPTARRLAMSAKKTLLLRHGFDSQAGAETGRA